MAKKKPKKAPPRTVYSDDLVIYEDGEEYYPHRGEWVQVRGGMSWRMMKAATRFQRFQGMNTAEVDESELEEIVHAYDQLLQMIVSKLVGWNWTDDQGEPLPEPSPEILEDLDQREIEWLMDAISGDQETEGERKNA